MKPIFIQYPKCSTCQRAARWLRDHGIEYTERNIVEDKPSANELADWIKQSGITTAKFFNTSGVVYRALGLKDIVKSAPDNILIEHLASDGKLIKRPILIGDKCILLGFNEQQWGELLLR